MTSSAKRNIAAVVAGLCAAFLTLVAGVALYLYLTEYHLPRGRFGPLLHRLYNVFPMVLCGVVLSFTTARIARPRRPWLWATCLSIVPSAAFAWTYAHANLIPIVRMYVAIEVLAIALVTFGTFYVFRPVTKPR